jgi:uncharacterized protein YndB with AHSA1/START domain
MSEIRESVEINRPPEEVFAYLDDVERHGEWQEDIVGVERVTNGPTRQGTRVRETRHVPGGNRSMTYEVTEHDPPRRSSFRVLDGPIRAVGTISVEPAGNGTKSLVTIVMDFEGHGIGGKLLLPVARSQARKRVPESQSKMKEVLERGA